VEAFVIPGCAGPLQKQVGIKTKGLPAFVWRQNILVPAECWWSLRIFLSLMNCICDFSSQETFK